MLDKFDYKFFRIFHEVIFDIFPPFVFSLVVELALLPVSSSNLLIFYKHGYETRLRDYVA